MATMMTETDKESTEDTSCEELEKAFVHLFNRYYRPVYSFFAVRGFSAEKSKDLCQDTFFRAYRSMPQLRKEDGMGNWIFRIATNLLRNAARSRFTQKRRGVEIPLEGILRAANSSAEDEEGGRSGRQIASDVEASSQAPEVLEKLLSDERARLLRDALGDLPPQMRLVVMLRVTQGEVPGDRPALETPGRYRQIPSLPGEEKVAG